MDDFGNERYFVLEQLEGDEFIAAIRASVRFVIDGSPQHTTTDKLLRHFGLI